jgi:hypothetical protein
MTARERPVTPPPDGERPGVMQRRCPACERAGGLACACPRAAVVRRCRLCRARFVTVDRRCHFCQPGCAEVSRRRRLGAASRVRMARWRAAKRVTA